jgi:spore maturation protein CgeB
MSLLRKADGAGKRVLIVHPGPDFSVADVYRGWEAALRALGCQVALYNTNDRLMFYSKALVDTNKEDETGHRIVRQAMSQPDAIRASMQGISHAAFAFWPDVILYISGFFMTGGQFELFSARQMTQVMMHTESPYQEGEQLERAKFMDLNLLNDPANIGAYKELGPALYMPHAYWPALHHPRTGPVDRKLASDLAFIGTAFQSRIKFFGAMDFTGIDFLLGGANWDEDLEKDSPLRRHLDQDVKGCVDNDQAAVLYQNAKTGINVYRHEGEDEHAGEGWAIGPREVEMAACGLFYLRESRGEGDELFPMLPTISSPEDATEKLRWWLAHDRSREAAATEARRAVADRTFEANARKLLKALEDL